MVAPGKLEVAATPDRLASMWAHTYTDLTASTDIARMPITAGRRERTSGLSPAQIEFTLNNGTGLYMPGNAESSLYPWWDQGALVRYRIEDQTPYLLMTGTSLATTADKASLDVTGDNFGAIQFRGPAPTARGILRTNTDVSRLAILGGKYNTTGDQRTWRVFLFDGLVRYVWSTDGTSANEEFAESTVIVPQPGAGSNTLGWFHDVNVGGTAHTVRFYFIRDDIDALEAAIAAGDETVHLGDLYEGSGTTSLHSGTADLVLGASSSGMWGQVEAFRWRSGNHTGTEAADIDFTIQTPADTSFADTAATPNTWTLSAGAVIADTEVRQVAEVASIRPRWPGRGVDEAAQVDVTANGISRRQKLNRRKKALQSSLFRWITTLDRFKNTIVAYWPYEDGADATQVSSPIDGVAPITLSGTYTLGDGTFMPAAKQVFTVANDDQCYQEAPIPPIPQVVGVNWQVIRYFNTDDPEPGPGSTQLMAIDTTGRAATWRITINDAQVAITAVDADDTPFVLDTVTATSQWFTLPMFVKLSVTDDGANVDYEVTVGFAAEDTGVSTTSGTYVGNTGVPVRFRNNIVGPPGGLSTSHLVVTTDSPQITEDPAAVAWVGELDYDRIRRLSLEERSYVSVHCANDDPGEPLGPQLPHGFVDLLEEAAAAGGGILHEHRTEQGYQYRTRRSMLNQAARLVVDQGLISPLEPAADDQGRANLVEVTRIDGSSSTAIDLADIEGPDGEGGRGEYPDNPQLSLHRDTQTGPLAGWLLHLGTRDEMRVETLTIEGAKDDTVLPAAWIRCAPGDIVSCENPPPWWPAESIDQLIEGYTETWSPHLATIVPNTSPASLWNVAAEGVARADTAGSVLNTGIDDNDTSLDVATTHRGTRWRSVAGGLTVPMGIDVAGEEMSVTDLDDTLFTFGAVGTVTHGNNASVTPGAPAGVVAGNLLVILAAIRNLGAGTVNVPSGWSRWPLFNDDENVALLARVAQANGEAMPLVTFSGGVANADTSAQCARFGGSFADVDNLPIRWGRVGSLSAQDIAYPATRVPYDNSLILYVGWKSDDWTSVASPGTEIGEPDTTTGDDQGIVWAYTIQTTPPADIAAGSFVVTGGAAAVVLGGVIVLTPDRQTFTVTRSANGVTKSHAAGAKVRLAAAERPVVAR